MAEKRMFTMKICDSDAFLDMPLSTQCLYFHLNMRADDDGFIGNPKRVIKLINASEDDLKLLLTKRFILAFETGVIVIKHWRMHNTIRSDRYNSTSYLDERNQLILKTNKSYKLASELDENEPFNSLATKRQPNGATGLGLGLVLDLGLDIGLEEKSSSNQQKDDEFSELDDSDELMDLFDIFQQEFKRPLSGTEIDKINYWVDKVGDKYIIHALRESLIANKLSIAYIDAILVSWTSKKFTLEDLNSNKHKQGVLK